MITLATLSQASAQEVFDQASRHLLEQGRRSQDGDDTCLYRSPGGLSCAAGCLMTDQEIGLIIGINPHLNHDDWQSLVFLDLAPTSHERLITDLQEVHDRRLVAEWPQALQTVAHEHQLEWRQ